MPAVNKHFLSRKSTMLYFGTVSFAEPSFQSLMERERESKSQNLIPDFPRKLLKLKEILIRRLRLDLLGLFTQSIEH